MRNRLSIVFILICSLVFVVTCGEPLTSPPPQPSDKPPVVLTGPTCGADDYDCWTRNLEIRLGDEKGVILPLTFQKSSDLQSSVSRSRPQITNMPNSFNFATNKPLTFTMTSSNPNREQVGYCVRYAPYAKGVSANNDLVCFPAMTNASPAISQFTMTQKASLKSSGSAQIARVMKETAPTYTLQVTVTTVKPSGSNGTSTTTTTTTTYNYSVDTSGVMTITTSNTQSSTSESVAGTNTSNLVPSTTVTVVDVPSPSSNPVSSSPSTYVVSGIITGLLSGNALTIKNNGTDTYTVATGTGSDIAFLFPTRIRSGAAYSVTVDSSPTGQTCTVTTDASGTNRGSNITDIVVTCTVNTYTVGGTLSGTLAPSTSVVLQNNSGDNLTLDSSDFSDGTFAFDTELDYGDSYSVTVSSSTGNNCVFYSGSNTGTVTSDVTTVVLSCAPFLYSIGGTISGVTDVSGLTLHSGSSYPGVLLTDPSHFSVNSSYFYNDTYSFSVAASPTGKTCTVSANGSGTVTGNVTNVAITCTTNSHTLGGTVTGLTDYSGLTLANGGDSLSVTGSTFTFLNSVNDGSSYNVTVSSSPSGKTCTVTANGSGTATADVSNVEITCVTNSKKIFITQTTTNGAMGGSGAGGIARADAICMADANKPVGGSTYKALISDNSARVACTSNNCGTGGTGEHVDWVLSPSTPYTRADGTTIGTTNSAGIFILGSLTNRFSGDSGVTYWTNLISNGSRDWETTSSFMCSGLSDNTGGVNGETGAGGAGGILSQTQSACNTSHSIICVEQ